MRLLLLSFTSSSARDRRLQLRTRPDSLFRTINPMASISSSVSAEEEVKLQNFFSACVRFHLLYKSSHHGADFDRLLDRFDNAGSYLLIAFLQSGQIRGAFISKALKYKKEYSDNKAFVFTLDGYFGRRFPGSSDNTTAVPVSVGSNSIFIKKGFKLILDNGCWYQSFSTNVLYGVRNSDEVNLPCVDVELHRVQGTFPPPQISDSEQSHLI